MEAAKIDWNRIDSRFIEDCVYEHINAPKWVDFLSIEEQHIDDEAWFCTKGCNHPRTAEDFLKASPLSKAPPRSVTGGGSRSRSSPFRELNQGDVKLKRRGQTNIQSSVFTNSENQNPNLSTPPPNQLAKSLKEAMKSSGERSKPTVTDGDISRSPNDETRRLKSTLSARNLFAGRDIMSHITEFCSELKKLATRAREKETEGKMDEGKIQAEERKPLLELGQEKPHVMQKGTDSAKEKERTKKDRIQEADAENMPPPPCLNLENVKLKDKEGLLQIRTNPPSPQCFSAPTKTTTPSKAPRSRLMERGILQEVKLNKDIKTDRPGSTVSTSIITNGNVTDGRQARGLDVFWFLKPCTLSE